MPAAAGVTVSLPSLPLPHRPHSHSRRVRARYNRAREHVSLLNSAFDSLNQLSVSFSSHHSPDFSFFSTGQNSDILPSVPHVSTVVRERMREHVSTAVRHFAASRRSALCDGHSPVPGDYTYNVARPMAVSLTADRCSLPQVAGTAPMLPLLPPPLRALYSSPAALLRPRDEVLPAPRAVLCATRADYVSLIGRLHSIGMLAWTRHPRAVNGVFGVPKDPADPGGALRLIIDARAANRTSAPRHQSTGPHRMCSLACWCPVTLPSLSPKSTSPISITVC